MMLNFASNSHQKQFLEYSQFYLYLLSHSQSTAGIVLADLGAFCSLMGYNGVTVEFTFNRLFSSLTVDLKTCRVQIIKRDGTQ